MSPGIVLAVLIVCIGAQLTRLLVPRRGNYLLAMVCAVLGLLAAELVALSGHGGPMLGTVPPAADVIGIVLAEAIGVAVAAPRRLGGR